MATNMNTRPSDRIIVLFAF